ncbi:MAG: META domain-containing protein [Muribaculaceae bacterium]|nr:META domain-containing protein [Muribaculaceae bacterium]
MNKLSLLALSAASLLASCTSNKQTESTEVESTDTIAAVDLNGQWYMERIAINDSVFVNPSEVVPDVKQYIIFDDSTYCVQTNCNSISGAYIQKGDSITLCDGAMTEMACENMATEDMLRKVIPAIATVTVENDSTITLNAAQTSEQIVLRKATENK